MIEEKIKKYKFHCCKVTKSHHYNFVNKNYINLYKFNSVSSYKQNFKTDATKISI